MGQIHHAFCQFCSLPVACICAFLGQAKLRLKVTSAATYWGVGSRPRFVALERSSPEVSGVLPCPSSQRSQPWTLGLQEEVKSGDSVVFL